MKCLNLIGQCEGSKSLRATVHVESTPQATGCICNTMLFMDTLKNVLINLGTCKAQRSQPLRLKTSENLVQNA